MKLWALASVLLIGSAVAAGEPAADAPPDRSAPGPAFSIGSGSLYGGGLGASGEWQFRPHPLIRVTPFVSVGAALASGADSLLPRFGWGGGVMGELGVLQRVFLLAEFGTQAVGWTCGTSPCSATATLFGPSAAVGYKGTAYYGLMWLAYVGWGWLLNETQDSRFVNGPVFGLGLGYKL